MTTTTKPMNSIQEDYIRAKAMLEIVKRQRLERLAENQHLICDGASDADVEEWIRRADAIDEQSGIKDAEKAFLEAQVNLLGWTRRELERLDWRREGYHEVMNLFERKLTTTQLNRLCEVCLKLRT